VAGNSQNLLQGKASVKLEIDELMDCMKNHGHKSSFTWS